MSPLEGVCFNCIALTAKYDPSVPGLGLEDQLRTDARERDSWSVEMI
jgi:hypothetical protein